MARANYTDAVSLNAVYGRAQADLALFGAADQATLQAAGQRVQRIVNDGAEQFGSDDAFTLLGDAIQAIDILTRSGCKK